MLTLFHYSYDTPLENIAVDEALLHMVNNDLNQNGILRLWESKRTFVVLGLSKIIANDVHEHACNLDNIPILKRCSGGGTVLQGAGCFNYSYILPISLSPQLESVSHTTNYVLSLVQSALHTIAPNSQQKGISDLVENNIKFSGNAQRRLKHAILFHGTILYQFDLTLVESYLKHPPIQPDYRKNRNHLSFIKNISTTYESLVQAFTRQTSEKITNTDVPIPIDILTKTKNRGLD
jgi:lipoate-protein ligase A